MLLLRLKFSLVAVKNVHFWPEWSGHRWLLHLEIMLKISEIIFSLITFAVVLKFIRNIKTFTVSEFSDLLLFLVNTWCSL